MYDKTGTCSTFLFMVVFFIGILVVFTDAEDHFNKSKNPKLEFSMVDESEPSLPDSSLVEQPGGQFWTITASITATIVLAALLGYGLQKHNNRQIIEAQPIEQARIQEPDLFAKYWNYSEELFETPVVENLLVETTQPDTTSLETESILEPPPAEIETALDVPASEEVIETDDPAIPPVDPQAITYQNLRALLNPKKENPLTDFLAQRAAVVLDQLAPRTSPIYKPEVLKIVDTTAKARQVLRLVINEKILNALKDQRSEGKEKYLMGAIGFHMMLFADEPFTTDNEFLITDKYMGKPYIQIGESTYHLKQQRISASSYHEMVSKFKEPVLELYLSTHFPEGILAAYQQHFQTSKLSQQFGIRETTNTNIKKFVESLVDDLAACATSSLNC